MKKETQGLLFMILATLAIIAFFLYLLLFSEISKKVLIN